MKSNKKSFYYSRLVFGRKLADLALLTNEVFISTNSFKYFQVIFRVCWSSNKMVFSRLIMHDETQKPRKQMFESRSNPSSIYLVASISKKQLRLLTLVL